MAAVKLFSGARGDTDLSPFELAGGHAGGLAPNGDHVEPSNIASNGQPYAAVGDAYRRSYQGAYPDTAGNRVFVDGAVPAGLGFPGNRGICTWVRTGDGLYVTGNPNWRSASGDAARIEWMNRADQNYIGGPYNGLPRLPYLPPVAGGGTGFPPGTMGQVKRFGFLIGFDTSWPTHTSGWCTVGPEWHHNFGVGPAPHLASLDVLNDKWSLSINGGDAGVYDTTTVLNDPRSPGDHSGAAPGYGWNGLYKNNFVFFDHTTGFLGAVRGPDGGGSGNWTALVDGPTGTAGTVIAASTGDPGQSAAFTGRTPIAKGEGYAIVYEYTVSDRDLATGDPWNPICPVRGTFRAFMAHYSGAWGPWLVICPQLTIATYYSIQDNVNSGRKSPGAWLLMGIYRKYVAGLGDAKMWMSEIILGDESSTLADVSFNGTDPNSGSTPTRPIKTADPTQSGVAQVGQVITGVAGSYSGGGITVTRQWYRYEPDGTGETLIASATNLTYTLVTADLYKTLRMKETATNSVGTDSGVSTFTGEVTPTAPSGANPSVLGSASGHSGGPATTSVTFNIPAGTKLLKVTVSDGHLLSLAASNPVTVTQAGVATALTLIAGSEKNSGSLADQQSYYLANPATGAQTVVVTNTGGGRSGAILVEAFDVVTAVGTIALASGSGTAPSVTVATVSGDLVVAMVSNASVRASGVPTVTGPGGTQVALASDLGDDGATYNRLASATKRATTTSTTLSWTLAPSSSWTAVAMVLHGTASVAVPVNQAAPVVSGTPQVGSSLVAGPGTDLNGPVTYTYQWQTDASGSFVDIAAPAEPNQAYAVRGGDVGHNIRCHIVATNAAGSVDLYTAARLISSVPVTPVPVNVNPPVISGTPTVGNILTVTPGDWS